MKGRGVTRDSFVHWAFAGKVRARAPMDISKRTFSRKMRSFRTEYSLHAYIHTYWRVRKSYEGLFSHVYDIGRWKSLRKFSCALRIEFRETMNHFSLLPLSESIVRIIVTLDCRKYSGWFRIEPHKTHTHTHARTQIVRSTNLGSHSYNLRPWSKREINFGFGRNRCKLLRWSINVAERTNRKTNGSSRRGDPTNRWEIVNISQHQSHKIEKH